MITKEEPSLINYLREANIIEVNLVYCSLDMVSSDFVEHFTILSKKYGFVMEVKFNYLHNDNFYDNVQISFFIDPKINTSNKKHSGPR